MREFLDHVLYCILDLGWKDRCTTLLIASSQTTTVDVARVRLPAFARPQTTSKGAIRSDIDYLRIHLGVAN